LFWAEKVSVLSNEDPRDVFNLAQCMFLLREFNRAAHIIRSRGLEKTNILCHYLLAECLLEAQEYQEALDLSCVDVEELSMHDSNVEDDEMKNVSATSIRKLYKQKKF
jgi:anaphase-promoting complex subunit 6